MELKFKTLQKLSEILINVLWERKEFTISLSKTERKKVLCFLVFLKRKPEFPVVTQESRHNSRKTTSFPLHRKMRPLPLQRLKRSLTFHLEVRYGTWHLWCDPKSSPTHWSHWRGTPRFPASPHLCPFSPPDRDRRVDSPALSARGSDLPGAPQDEAGLTRKFET